MKKKKYIALIIALAMVFSVKNACFDVKAGENKVKDEETIETIQLSSVVENAYYPEITTDEQEWKVNDENEYEFPVNAGDNEWLELETHGEMMEACSVPEEVLEDASTDQLLEMVLDYPLLCDIYAYDTVEEGVAVVASRFNGFEELMSRDDFEEVVLDRYIETDVDDATSNQEEIFTDVTEIVVLEDILAQEEVIESYSDKKIEELIEAVEEKTEDKIEADTYYGNESTFYDVATNNGVIEELDIKELPELVDDAVSASATTTTVKTPKGTKVTVIKDSYKGDTWAASLTNQFRIAYPHAIILAKADNRYNCHSYAWYSASTTNRYWMNDPKPYVNDGSYKYVGTSPTASGQKVVYAYQKVPYDIWEHSAITVNKTGTLRSKWGQAPLMQHSVNYCPYVGNYVYIHYYK